jgi:hypothetical protein
LDRTEDGEVYQRDNIHVALAEIWIEEGIMLKDLLVDLTIPGKQFGGKKRIEIWEAERPGLMVLGLIESPLDVGKRAFRGLEADGPLEYLRKSSWWGHLGLGRHARWLLLSRPWLETLASSPVFAGGRDQFGLFTQVFCLASNCLEIQPEITKTILDVLRDSSTRSGKFVPVFVIDFAPGFFKHGPKLQLGGKLCQVPRGVGGPSELDDVMD